ncbi:hypothetical protein [Nodularia spumigena]|uniref:hypothetical protein n=1 Tax=Nodularia spumigena TaxID=70799 RepID=UPI002B1FCF62|nr:hypothetical protein [Nodularia spumigena]MEA5615413.1 hypothetical protein [Nodularia spumigena UHCC 0040]
MSSHDRIPTLGDLFSPEELELTRKCLLAGADDGFIEDFEYDTLIKASRSDLAGLALQWQQSTAATAPMLAAATNVVNNIGRGPAYLAENFVMRFPCADAAKLTALATRLHELTSVLHPEGIAAYWRGSRSPRSLD